MNKALVYIVTAMSLALGACGSVKVVLDPRWDGDRKPSYVDYVDYYWWGLKGRPGVTLQTVCMDQKPMAFQRLRTGEDITIGIFTLGIYLPATVRVWCGDQ